MQDSIKKWYVLSAVGVMILLVNLDMTIVNLALPVISKNFHASLIMTQWVIAIYLLSTAIFFSIFGRLADFYGKRFIFVIGSFIFTTASLLAGLAQNIEILIAARFLQGLGFAATLSMAILLIVTAFPSHQRGFATGAAITITGLGQAIGPIIGGLILSYFGWRWIFLMNVPLGIISFISTFLVVAPDLKSDRPFSLSYIGVSLFIIGLSSILVGLNQVAFLSLNLVLFLIGGGIVLLLLFFVNSLKSSKPFIDVRLLKNWGYLNVVMIRGSFMFMMCGLLFILPLCLQNILEFSPMKTGLLLLVMTVLVGIFSPITGRVLDKINFKWPILVSMVLASLSSVFFILLKQDTSVVILVAGLLLFGLSMGIHIPATVHGVLVESPKESSGSAMGLFFTMAIASGVAGVAICGAVLDIHSQNVLNHAMQQQHLYPAKEIIIQLMQTANGSRSFPLLLPVKTDLPVNILKTITTTSFLSAFQLIMYINLVLSIAGVTFSLMLRKKELTEVSNS